MQLSKYFYKTIKEIPGDTELKSHILLIRGGYIKQVSSGIFSYLPLAVRCLRKIEAVIRQEMDAAGGHEINMPVVMPASLWQETGRYESIGAELIRCEDRVGRKMLLGMTHEEAVTDLARYVINSYKELPVILYQLQTKFRDEPRARGGLIRVREFVMNDAYSFHTTEEDLDNCYNRLHQSYLRIFNRCGLPVISVASDVGMMGGYGAHEFMAVTETGEDSLVICSSCSYKANREVAAAKRVYNQSTPLPMKAVQTPGYKTIEEVSNFLKIRPGETMKSVVYDIGGEPVMCLIRGDLGVNEIKLKKYLEVKELYLAAPDLLKKNKIVEGYASPVGISGVRIIIDHSIAESTNLTGGANKKNHHIKNINFPRDFTTGEIIDLANVNEGENCPECGKPLALTRGIEVGNIFKLGTKYSHTMKAAFLNESGKSKDIIMGCYGIGIGRLMASVLELRAGEKKICWPISIAPFEAELIGLAIHKDEKIEAACFKAYEKLGNAGIEVLFDDRKTSPGIKFNDADLIGAPIRITIGKRSIRNGGAEVQAGSSEPRIIPLEELEKVVADIKAKFLMELK